MLGELYKFKDCRTKRASSFDKSGDNQDFIKFLPGETKTIVEKDKRQNMADVWVTDIHRWRNAWRESMGRGRLWGNEKPQGG